MFECIDESLAHGFIILPRVADVGEDLCEGLFIVDADEVLVLGQLLRVQTSRSSASKVSPQPIWWCSASVQ